MWSYCPSFTTIELRFDNSKLVEFQTIEKVVSDEMNKNQNFKFMLDLVFFKDYDTLKKSEKEINCVWQKKRSRHHSFGKVKIFMSDGWYSYGTDQAGSAWKQHEFGK